nr:DUF169 domain-containing protein [Clostridioides sp.]
MPIKHKAISYGLPQDKFNTDLIKDYCEDLNCILYMQRKPVGVKLLFTEDEYNDIDWREPGSQLAYCCMVEKATRGMSFRARLKHINCDGGTTALALEPSTPRIESGAEYFSYNLYATQAAARRVREGVKGLYRTGAPTYGIAVGPLEDFEITPDVVILIVNPYQAMRLQQGYVYHTGERINSTLAAMQGICSEVTVEPYIEGRMNISTLCPSTRFLAKWKSEEMAIGLPFERFTSTVEGVLATLNTTDNVDKKEEIAIRFKEKNKDASFITYDVK